MATKRACVMGYPVKHSRSPMLHGYWIRKYGLEAEYRREEVAPDQFEAFVTNLERNGYVGGNVTMPHKDAAFRLSIPDARARAVGAANTLWLDNGTLRSTNTDVEGFIAALDAASPGWDRRTQRAVVLGAGGAGRAVVCGFVERGIPEVHIVNRDRSKVDAMRTQFGPAIHPASWSDLPRLLDGADLLANTTSLGMAGKEQLAIDLTPLADHAVVGEVVYVPLVTPLLAAAKARGLATSDGLDMLLHQAVRGFELWFGVRPEVTPELRALLVADILKTS